MSGELTSSNRESDGTNELSHRRILKILILQVFLGTVLGAALHSYGFGAGIFLGGTAAFLNYFWLRSLLRKILENPVETENGGRLATRFVLRYFLIGCLVLIVYLTGIVPVIAVLIGLAGFAIAVVFEGIINIFGPVKV